jgi:hypothetical protein
LKVQSSRFLKAQSGPWHRLLTPALSSIEEEREAGFGSLRFKVAECGQGLTTDCTDFAKGAGAED